MNADRTIVLVVALLVVGSVPAVLAASTSGTTAAPADAVEGDAVQAQETTTEDGQDGTQADGEQTTAAEGDQTANVTFADQTSNGSAVVVEQLAITATKPAGGFVSIHLAASETDGATETEADTAVETETDAAVETEMDTAVETEAGIATETETDAAESVTEDEIGERIVVSRFLEPGNYQNLTIQLNETLEEDATLIAVVHRDSQGNEEFDPEADQPFEVDGSVVADAANVTVSGADGATTVGEGTDGETTVDEEDDGEATVDEDETTTVDE